MTVANRIIRAIDTFNTTIGRWLAWLTLAMALVVALIVVVRSGFNLGSIAAQESITYMHATLFMLCLAYTAREQGHVRVDIFYQHFSPVTRAWIDGLGALTLLLPFALFLIFISWQTVSTAWTIRETSSDPGGIPALFLLKSLIPMAGVLLALHALADALRALLTLTFIHNSDT